MSDQGAATLTTVEERTAAAADALVALYGAFNADFLANVLTAKWMTEGERRAFTPLADALLVRAEG